MNEQINPHEAALVILAEAEQNGQRLAFDPEIVVLADIYPNKNNVPNPVK